MSLLALRTFLVLSLCHQAVSNPCGRHWREWNCQCYYLSDYYLDWLEANMTCQSKDSFLVSIHSEQELEFIKDMTNQGSYSSFWTGLNNLENANVWSYTDGTEPDFLKWFSGEPRNDSNTQCMEVKLIEPSTDAGFNSSLCTLSKLFACKKISEIHPVLADDLASPEIYPQAYSAILYWKNWPVFEGCSRSIMLSSHDLNVSALILGPNQTNDFSYQITDLQPDTAYDFFIVPSGKKKFTNRITFVTKKQPMASETSIIESSCDSGWTMYNCSCYHLGTQRVSWKQARLYCQYAGADLVSIHSEEEQEFVSAMHARQAWIGLTDESSEGDYKWTDGSPYDYRMWHAWEPNDRLNEEDCVENVAWYGIAQWNDVSCHLPWQYICKKKPSAIKNITSPSVHAGAKGTIIFWQQTSTCLRMQVTNIRTRQQWIIEGDSNGYSLAINNLQPQEFHFFHIIPVLQNEVEERRFETRISFWTPACDDCKPVEAREEGCPVVFECPAGWVSKRCYCYRFREFAETWDEANDSCQRMGANLLSILSMEEQTFIDEYTKEEVWIGLNRLKYENNYLWSDESPFHFSNWEEAHFLNRSDLFTEETTMETGMNTISDDEQLSSTGSQNKSCASKGSIRRNNGRWLYADCRERKKVICKKVTELTSVTPPTILVQPSLVYAQWIGICKCRASIQMVYEQEETGKDRRTRYRTFENETYLSDDKFGLDPGTMYKLHIEATSSKAVIRNNTSIDVLFQTPGPYPQRRRQMTTTSPYEGSRTTSYGTKPSFITTYAPFSPMRTIRESATSTRYYERYRRTTYNP